MIKEKASSPLTLEDFKTEVLKDYKLAMVKSNVVLLGRRSIDRKTKFEFLVTGKKYRNCGQIFSKRRFQLWLL
jgi:hypothetical protein